MSFVCLVQAYQALYDLPVLVDSNEGLDTLTEFVAEQKDKLKKMCSIGERALFHHFEENLCECDTFHELF